MASRGIDPMDAELAKRTRAPAISTSSAWVILTANQDLEILSGTGPIEHTVQGFSNLLSVMSALEDALCPSTKGGFFDPYPQVSGVDRPSSPIKLPKDIESITVAIADGSGTYVTSGVPYAYNIFNHIVKDTTIWDGRFDDILLPHERSKTHPMQGLPLIAVKIRDPAVEAYYDMFPHLRAIPSIELPDELEPAGVPEMQMRALRARLGKTVSETADSQRK